MKITRPIVLMSFLFHLVIFGGCSDNRKVDYQLQEECGKKCKDYYEKTDNLFKDNQFTQYISYQNHYNKKLNKCFILLQYMSFGDMVYTLMDVNENKVLGGVRVKGNAFLRGHLLGKKCKSEKEWEQLIKPYMDE